MFNQSRVQAQIANAIKKRTGVSVTVDCPRDPSLSPSSQFQCVATASDGSTVMVNVTIQDNSGDYTWQTAG